MLSLMLMLLLSLSLCKCTSTTDIYTNLHAPSLHYARPIWCRRAPVGRETAARDALVVPGGHRGRDAPAAVDRDHHADLRHSFPQRTGGSAARPHQFGHRKSTSLKSSH